MVASAGPRVRWRRSLTRAPFVESGGGGPSVATASLIYSLGNPCAGRRRAPCKSLSSSDLRPGLTAGQRGARKFGGCLSFPRRGGLGRILGDRGVAAEVVARVGGRAGRAGAPRGDGGSPAGVERALLGLAGEDLPRGRALLGLRRGARR